MSGTLGGHRGSVEAVALQEALSLALTASMDGRVIVWDLQTLSVRGECEHGGGVSLLAKLSADSPAFLTAGAEGVVRLWDARTSGSQRAWSGHRDAILDMALADQLIVTGSEDGTTRVFSLGG